MFGSTQPAMGNVTSSAERSYSPADAMVGETSPPVVVGTADKSNPGQPISVGTTYGYPSETTTFGSTGGVAYRPTNLVPPYVADPPGPEFGSTNEPVNPIYPIHSGDTYPHVVEIGHTSGPSRPLYPVHSGDTSPDVEIGHTSGPSRPLHPIDSGMAAPHDVEFGRTSEPDRIIYPTESESMNTSEGK